MASEIPLWTADSTHTKQIRNYRNICIIMLIAFVIGILVGIFIPTVLTTISEETYDDMSSSTFQYFITIPSTNVTTTSNTNTIDTHFSAVQFVENDGLIEEGIFWGRQVESNLPKGYTTKDNDLWVKFVEKSSAVRLESGCGRMQNRMVIFQDGTKGCVRYRQNLDQIQGELFSFYLAQLLQLPNLAPSTISLVDLQSATWKNLPSEIASAQWSSNRPIVVTKFIPDLGTANIPQGFRPPDNHLSQKYVLDQNVTNDLSEFIELAQWSDLVILDYLTANLDRVVNNLYNKQWNINIMEAPAHNLARNSDNLLVFLDNESGLLHGYRLLQKYEPYHSLLLENLCLFRKRTVLALEKLRREKNVGKLLVQMFESKTTEKIRDFLPPLPEKSIKILNERLDRVYGQIARCRRNVEKGL